ncbi:hypothetical protein QFC24_007071 [Naganishia onofrii]|uniref:Uncharacterized protein n=1 Tax=Naganishia onofrii TaxID=1851511 RepID=A0ACC2WV25_9TREE|nr:hypothetical protein QFC24_007071 [Naganishia onofrii]
MSHQQPPIAPPPTPATTTTTTEPLALPPPPSEETKGRSLNVQEENKVALDELGPLIVNSDGTLSRIQNWQCLSDVEKERMVRLIVKRRNVQRLDKLKDQEADEGKEAEVKEDERQVEQGTGGLTQ